jgi:hypothetical protein
MPSSPKEGSPIAHKEAQLLDRRGRRLPLDCRMFFFGDDDFEGEATVLDVSTNGCRAETSVEVKVEMQLKLSLMKNPALPGGVSRVIRPLA